MAGFQSAYMPRPTMNGGRPATPVVPRERVQPQEVVTTLRHQVNALKERIATLEVALSAQKTETTRWREEAMKAVRAHADDSDVVLDVLPVDRAREIVKAHAARHRISVKDLLGTRRDKLAVRARYDAIAEVATTFPDWSLPRIGRFFGRDHTTILHALRKRGVWGVQPAAECGDVP